jgi:hypothetical protein
MRHLTKKAMTMLLPLASMLSFVAVTTTSSTASASPAALAQPTADSIPDCPKTWLEPSMAKSKSQYVSIATFSRRIGPGPFWLLQTNGQKLLIKDSAHVENWIASETGFGVCRAIGHGHTHLLGQPVAPPPVTTTAPAAKPAAAAPVTESPPTTSPAPATRAGQNLGCDSYGGRNKQWMQCKLAELGFYDGPIDDKYGNMSINAERAWQKCQWGDENKYSTGVNGPSSQVYDTIKGKKASEYAECRGVSPISKANNSSGGTPDEKSTPLETSDGLDNKIVDALFDGTVGTGTCAIGTVLALGVGAVATGGATGGAAVVAGFACIAGVFVWIGNRFN